MFKIEFSSFKLSNFKIRLIQNKPFQNNLDYAMFMEHSIDVHIPLQGALVQVVFSTLPWRWLCCHCFSGATDEIGELSNLPSIQIKFWLIIVVNSHPFKIKFKFYYWRSNVENGQLNSKKVAHWPSPKVYERLNCYSR